MMEIEINCESRYLVDKDRVRQELLAALSSEGIQSPAAVSLLICGKRKVRELSRRYLKVPEDHNVLSFVFSEVQRPFIDYADGLIRLGDIVVCYSMAQEQAMEENRLVDDVVIELATHGLHHLLGQHHHDEIEVS